MSTSPQNRQRIANRIIQNNYGLSEKIASSIVDTYFRLAPRKTLTGSECESLKMVAHRGCHNGLTGVYENTMQAFDIAMQAGVWGIEFDVQWTSDNVPVVCHDPHTARNPEWVGIEIGRSSFDELRRLCPEIPRLAEVVHRFGKHVHLMVEVKKHTISHAGVNVLESELDGLQPCVDYHLMVLDASLLKYLESFPPRSRLLIATTNTRSMFAAALKHEIGGLTGHYLLLNSRMRKALSARNLKWGTGYVDSLNLLARELRSGTTWIFSEFADAMMQQVHTLR